MMASASLPDVYRAWLAENDVNEKIYDVDLPRYVRYDGRTVLLHSSWMKPRLSRKGAAVSREELEASLNTPV